MIMCVFPSYVAALNFVPPSVCLCSVLGSKPYFFFDFNSQILGNPYTHTYTHTQVPSLAGCALLSLALARNSEETTM